MSERDDWAEINRLEAELAQARADIARAEEAAGDYQALERTNAQLQDELAAANGRVHAAELHAAGMHTQRDEAIRDRDAARAELAAANERLDQISDYNGGVAPWKEWVKKMKALARIDALTKGDGE